MEFFDQMSGIKFVYKIQNGYLNFLLKSKDPEHISKLK